MCFVIHWQSKITCMKYKSGIIIALGSAIVICVLWYASLSRTDRVTRETQLTPQTMERLEVKRAMARSVAQ